MEVVLKSYLEKCQLIFYEHNSNFVNQLISLKTSTHIRNNRQSFEKAIKEAENTSEFEAFVIALQTGPLSVDIERLAKKEETTQEKAQKERPVKFQDIDNWKRGTARQAARGFLRNTAVYVNLWQGLQVEEASLLSILQNYSERKDSKFIRLFVFDGFVLYDNKKQLNYVSLPSLPIGDLKKYTEKELEDVLRIPQSVWHWNINTERIKKAAIWHILTIIEKEEYRGMTGIWFNDTMISPIDGEQAKKVSDIGIIGPVFLCIGQNANLAVEIRVSTNIFEYYPVHEIVKNDYLPWDLYNNEGEPGPRNFVCRIGKAGDKLRRVWEIWHKINDLDTADHLRYPTETYVRSVMNLHVSWERSMETFVGFVTVIESLLTPGTREELRYKMAIRGASILDSDPENRMKVFHVLDGFYKIRSQIVHEGRTEKDDPHELSNIISNNLAEISRQILLRYICLLYLALNGDIPGWVLMDSRKLTSRGSRSKVIARILDSLVLDPNLTNQLEEKMRQWGVFEDWKRMVGFRLA